MAKIYALLSSDLQNIKGLPIALVVKMLLHRAEEKREQRQWDLYLMRYQHMDQKTYKPYEHKAPNPSISKRPTEEILSEVQEIRARLARISKPPT